MDRTKEKLTNGFKKYFNYTPDRFFISPGRLEIIGNHTDHNHGLALVASASLYIRAAAKKRNDDIVNLNSEGSEFYNIKVTNNKPNEAEYSTTFALIKGVANGFIKRGYKVGGFDAYCFSEVPSGGGVSSSAAFELLICAIFNNIYNEGKVNCIEMAKISQEAERDFFGKPCGILDQIGCAYGGICIVDFNDPLNPIVNNTSFPFDLKILLSNPGGSHAGLTSYYAAIPNDMKIVAHSLKKEFLRETTIDEFSQYLKNNPNAFTASQINRATHFYLENVRVQNAYKAILTNNEEEFIKNINESGMSSSTVLANTLVPGRYKNSPERALRLARKVAPKSGHRVHGGGFMGTVISFVKPDEYKHLVNEIHHKFGIKNAIDVAISPFGAKEY